MERKFLISRHGAKDKDKNLKVEAIPCLYSNGMNSLANFYANRDSGRNAVVLHTSARRTLDSAKAVVAGMRRDQMPATLEELSSMDLTSGFSVVEDPLFSYDRIELDMDYVKEVGPEAYINEWMQKPDADKLAENPVTPWDDVKDMTVSALQGYLTQPNTDLGIVVTHGGVIEPLFAKLVESGTPGRFPLTSLDDIGGQFAEGEYAIVTLREISDGKLMRYGNLERGGITYPVDFAEAFPTKMDLY